MAGLLGAGMGVLLVVGGVWTLRRLAGRPPGLAWAIACGAAAVRWGTFDVGGIQAATRSLAPTLLVAPAAGAAGAAIALLAALAEESRADGLRSGSWAEQLAAAVAVVVLVPLFAAPGPGGSPVVGSILWWVVATAVLGAVTLAVTAPARRLPGWVPTAGALAGVLLIAFSAARVAA